MYHTLYANVSCNAVLHHTLAHICNPCNIKPFAVAKLGAEVGHFVPENVEWSSCLPLLDRSIIVGLDLNGETSTALAWDHPRCSAWVFYQYAIFLSFPLFFLHATGVYLVLKSKSIKEGSRHNKNLIKDNNGAIPVARWEHQALSIRWPMAHARARPAKARQRKYSVHISEFVIVVLVELCEQTDWPRLLCIMVYQ